MWELSWTLQNDLWLTTIGLFSEVGIGSWTELSASSFLLQRLTLWVCEKLELWNGQTLYFLHYPESFDFEMKENHLPLRKSIVFTILQPKIVCCVFIDSSPYSTFVNHHPWTHCNYNKSNTNCKHFKYLDCKVDVPHLVPHLKRRLILELCMVGCGYKIGHQNAFKGETLWDMSWKETGLRV